MLLKRRLSVLWAAAIVLLTVLACSGIALAITKTCSSSPCYGTNKDDTLNERRGVNDEIIGLRGDDTIGRRVLPRAPDTDTLRGNGGSDRLKSGDYDGRDVLYGGKGRDVCTIDSNDSERGCEKLLVVVD